MLLFLGVVLWFGLHLGASLRLPIRSQLIAKVGEKPYKGIFSLCLLGALALIVLGWRAFPPEALWVAPGWMRHVTMVLMPIAVILFVSARAPTDIKQYIRHPQLTGVKLWAFAHLLSNGNARDIILFGGLLAWAVAEVIVINRREGAWQKPAPVGAAKTAVSAAIGIVVTAVLFYLHRWLSGVPLV